MTNIYKLALGATLALAAIASPAFAQDSRIAIKLADLNLASKEGQRSLALRIDRAARAHCDTANERFGAEVRSEQAACRAAITARVNAIVAEKMAVQLAAR